MLRFDVIHDATRPISKIAAVIEPYLRVLAEEFHPEQVILFGSYAYGEPDQHSDVDLLVVKKIERSPVKDALAIQRRWGEVVGRQALPLELIVESPEGHRERLRRNSAFYCEIVQRGLRVL